MRILAVLVLLCAAGIFAVGLNEEEAFALLGGLLIGAAGLTLWDHGSKKRPRPAPMPPELERRLEQLEAGLRSVREEVALTSKDVSLLQEERDFLRQLYPAAPGAAVENRPK